MPDLFHGGLHDLAQVDGGADACGDLADGTLLGRAALSFDEQAIVFHGQPGAFGGGLSQINLAL